MIVDSFATTSYNYNFQFNDDYGGTIKKIHHHPAAALTTTNPQEEKTQVYMHRRGATSASAETATWMNTSAYLCLQIFTDKCQQCRSQT